VEISFTLNGEAVQVSNTSPQTTLLEYIRSRNLTGAKEACAEGECGVCAVVWVRQRCGQSTYQAVNSCLVFLPMAHGQEIYTVESLGTPQELHPVQRALAEGGGSQCGYCTPGFVTSLFAEQYRPGRNGPCEVLALSGNLCRCTGYRPIHDAALALGPAPKDEFQKRLHDAAPIVGSLAYTDGEASFNRPASLAEALATLRTDPDSRPVAGNTDLGVESNLKYKKYPRLLSLEAIPDLALFRESEDQIEIGAALCLDELQSRWQSAPLVVREWFPLFASPLIRNRATLGGNLATASPIGDVAPLLLALDARLIIGSETRRRSIPLQTFFTGYRRTVLQSDELILSVIIPKPLPVSARFFKAAKRRIDDISTVAACFAVSLDHAHRVEHARIAFGGVAAMPVRVREAEDSLIGQPWSILSIHRAQAVIAGVLQPMSDHRGSAGYRLALAQSLLEKFWSQSEEVAA
jgi:xanthine dehydrogenase small subunit